MNSKRRPSLSSRTYSTPLDQMNVSSSKPKAPFANMLTPPSSPRQTRSSTDLSSQDSGRPSFDENYLLNFTENGTLLCPYDVEIITDNRRHKQIFGYGAWSTVFKATCHDKVRHSSGLMTPPPTSTSRPPLLVAVKVPARKDAHTILENEAKILSRLMSLPEHADRVTTFYGILPAESSLVLAAYPLSLEQHITTCAKRARTNLTTTNMFEPVIGDVTTWLRLAYQLISTLEWLHNEAQIVHGDVKPGNILLQSVDPMDMDSESLFPYHPIFSDFSSSQLLDSDEISANTLSAVTREYTAPELLSSAVLRDPKSTATVASDVFSLAVTLLVAATGNTMVYPGTVFQRQMLATQGWHVLDCARNTDDGSRVPRHGVVNKILEKAVLKINTGRISATRWKELVEQVVKDSQGPSKL